MGVENIQRPFQKLKLVVHFKFNRSGCQAEAFHFLGFELDIGLNHIFGEDAATGQELVIVSQRIQRFIKIGANGRDLGVFFGRQTPG